WARLQEGALARVDRERGLRPAGHERAGRPDRRHALGREQAGARYADRGSGTDDRTGSTLAAMKDRTIRILLVDDHPVVREGLAGMIATQKDMEVVGEAGNGLEAVRQAQALRPDLILLDLQMPARDGA